jgi:hypothetical protein
MENYLSSIVTFVVGFIALFIYQKQKRDHKKNAANILIIEIEGAERQLQTLKESGTPKTLKEGQYLMPSSSWSKYRHLFARDFTSREWDILTNFYNRCQEFDDAVRYNGTFFRQDVEAYRTSINRVLAEAAFEVSKESEKDTEEDDQKRFDAADKKYLARIATAIKLYMEPKNLYTYDPQKPINDAVAALGSMESTISTSTIGVKLRKIAKQPLLQRIFSRRI